MIVVILYYCLTIQSGLNVHVHQLHFTRSSAVDINDVIIIKFIVTYYCPRDCLVPRYMYIVWEAIAHAQTTCPKLKSRLLLSNHCHRILYLYSVYRDWKQCIFWVALWVVLVAEQLFIKHPYTGRYQAINPYTTMADKEMTFCTISVNGYLRNAKVYPQSRPSMKSGRPSTIDTWGNKMKLRDLWEAWEVHVCQFRLSNMTTKIVFVLLNALKSIRPDSEILHYRPLPSE